MSATKRFTASQLAAHRSDLDVLKVLARNDDNGYERGWSFTELPEDSRRPVVTGQCVHPDYFDVLYIVTPIFVSANRTLFRYPGKARPLWSFTGTVREVVHAIQTGDTGGLRSVCGNPPDPTGRHALLSDCPHCPRQRPTQHP